MTHTSRCKRANGSGFSGGADPPPTSDGVTVPQTAAVPPVRCNLWLGETMLFHLLRDQG
jgi:hypothetical protein